MTQLSSTAGYAVSDLVKQRAADYAGGLPGGNNQTWERPSYLFHRVNMPVAGTGKLQFFNEARQPYITNMDVQATLPGNYAFILATISVSFLFGFDRLGARQDGARSNLSNGAVESATDILQRQWEAQEYYREVMMQGEFNFRVAQRPVIDQHFGLVNFPEGSGIGVSGASSSSSTTAGDGSTFAAMTQHNGAPLFANRFTFNSPYPILSGQQIQADINWNTIINAGAAGYPYAGSAAVTAGTMMVTLGGVMISPGSA